ncbi:hypothetical protein [Kitasatospora purpeofusca]|uniref:hypothetical protein n=1 Tax=Kitasatospora purpeofusca TaxID=67352 RepID=UPI0036BC8AAA
MTTLNFTDLKAEADRKAGGSLKFVAENGRKVKLRRIEAVPGADLKAVLSYMDVMQSDKVSDGGRIEAMGNLLVVVSTDKKAMRASLDALPLESVITICEAWMESVQAGEASA